MNKDIRLSIDFLSHRKRKKLQKRLGADGVLALIDLWLSTGRQRPSGSLTGYDEFDIELDANWSGEEGVFVKTLVEIGFLDEESGTYSLHNWADRQEWVVDSIERSDTARFSRLAKVNPSVYKELKAKGINKISKKEYKKANESLTNVNEPSTDGQQGVNDVSTPAPAPAPAPAHNGNKIPNGISSKPKVSTPVCPYEKIRNLYNELLPELPTCTDRNKTFDKMVKARWLEKKERQSLDWWKELFLSIKESDFLMGRKTDFQASLDWIVKPTNMTKILNGNYKNKNSSDKHNGFKEKEYVGTPEDQISWMQD